MVKLFVLSFISLAVVTGCSPQKRSKHKNKTEFVTTSGDNKPADNKPTQAKPDSKPQVTAAPSIAKDENKEQKIVTPPAKLTPAPSAEPSHNQGKAADNKAVEEPVVPTTLANELDTSKNGSNAKNTSSTTTQAPATEKVDTKTEPPKPSNIPSLGRPQSAASGQQKASDDTNKKTDSKAQNGRQFLEMTYDETSAFMQILKRTYSQRVQRDIIEPFLADVFDGEQLDVEFSVNQGKGHYRLIHKKAVAVEFKDFDLPYAKTLDLQSSEYKITGFCIGSKCEVLFVSVYTLKEVEVTDPKTQKKQKIKAFNVNIPTFFKTNGSSYQIAQPMEDAKGYGEMFAKNKLMTAEEREQLVNKLPPQTRVSLLRKANQKKYNKRILEIIHDRMQKTNAVYSAYAYLHVTPYITFDRTEKGLRMNLPYAPDKVGDKDPKKDILIDKEKGGTGVMNSIHFNVYPIIPDQFFLLSVEREQAKDMLMLKDYDRGHHASLCQIVEEEKQVYYECMGYEVSRALGTIAFEGRVGGPIWVGNKTVQEGGKTVEKANIQQTYTPEFDLKDPEEE